MWLRSVNENSSIDLMPEMLSLAARPLWQNCCRVLTGGFRTITFKGCHCIMCFCFALKPDVNAAPVQWKDHQKDQKDDAESTGQRCKMRVRDHRRHYPEPRAL